MEYQSGNIFIREMKFAKEGDVVHGHTHNFDHTTYVARGALLIEKVEPIVGNINDGSGNTIEAIVAWKVIKSVTKRAADGQNWVLIKADVYHRITALEDNSMGHCIYSHRDPQTGEIVQESNGWDEAHG